MRLDISETAAESLQLQLTEICGAIGRARVLPETRTEIQILCGGENCLLFIDHVSVNTGVLTGQTQI